jgi:hypothetical protein
MRLLVLAIAATALTQTAWAEQPTAGQAAGDPPAAVSILRGQSAPTPPAPPVIVMPTPVQVLIGYGNYGYSGYGYWPYYGYSGFPVVVVDHHFDHMHARFR